MRLILKIFKKIILYFIGLSILSVVLLKFLPVPFTVTMIDRKLSAIKEGNDSKIHYKWRSYNQVSRQVHLAAVAAEDQNFPQHNGFDVKAMKKAIEGNKTGKKVRGGSTISQQVAKNVFLWQKRSYLRKALEFYFTGLIELIWGKQRILEVYVNVAEMGKNTFGVEAAAQSYFKKPAKDLTRAEAARLAAVLPSPVKWSAANPGPYVARRTAHIQKQMQSLGGVKYLEGLRSF